MSSPWDGIIPEYAVRQISKKTRKLVGRYGFTQSDGPDIEQQLAVAVWQRLPKYDAAKGGLDAFIYWVIKRAAASLVERQMAEKRGGGHCVRSLDSPIRGEDGKPVPVSEITAEAEAGRRLGLEWQHFTAGSDRKIALEEFLNGLEGELRDLFLRLMAGQTFTEIHNDTGISRGTLYDQRSQLLGLMEGAGLREFLPSSGASDAPPVGNQ